MQKVSSFARFEHMASGKINKDDNTHFIFCFIDGRPFFAKYKLFVWNLEMREDRTERTE